MRRRLTDRTRSVLMMAEAAARFSGPSDISADDFILALAIHGKGVACETLRKLGVEPKSVLHCFDDQKVASAPNVPIRGKSSILPSTEASLLVRQAAAEADAAGHDYVGTEHLLIAAMQESGVAIDFLVGLGVSQTNVRSTVLGFLSHLQKQGDGDVNR